MKAPIAFLALLLLICSDDLAQERFITIESSRIWVNTIGLDDRQVGQPVVVFESGLGTSMGHWDRILDGVSRLAPLVTYDRPGIGASEADKEMPTIKNVADKLVHILQHLDIAPPYVLVGHSLGGVYVRGFAVYYPEMLAGLVIIDPADFTENKRNRRAYYEEMGFSEERIVEIMQTLYYSPLDDNASESIREEKQVLADLREDEFSEIKSVPLPKTLPVHIILGGRFDMPERMRSSEFDEEALFRIKMKHRTARWINVIQSVDKGMFLYSGDAGHFVQYDDPDLVVASIGLVLQDYRTMQHDKHSR
jgi:pimeloyl-ACP methyl ester carboxylesterase